MADLILQSQPEITIVDTTPLPAVDNSGVWGKISWLSIKNTLKTYFDTFYATIANLALKANDNAVVHNLGNESIWGSKNFSTNSLFVDSINNRIGIWTATPLEKLEVIGNVRVSWTWFIWAFSSTDSTRSQITSNRLLTTTPDGLKTMEIWWWAYTGNFLLLGIWVPAGTGLYFDADSISWKSQNWTWPWTAYTPTVFWDGWSGATIAINVARFKLVWKTCTFSIRAILTNKWTCTGEFKISTPVTVFWTDSFAVTWGIYPNWSSTSRWFMSANNNRFFATTWSQAAVLGWTTVAVGDEIFIWWSYETV